MKKRSNNSILDFEKMDVKEVETLMKKIHERNKEFIDNSFQETEMLKDMIYLHEKMQDFQKEKDIPIIQKQMQDIFYQELKLKLDFVEKIRECYLKQQEIIGEFVEVEKESLITGGKH